MNTSSSHERLTRAHGLEVSGHYEEAVAEYEALLENEFTKEEEAPIRKHLGNLHLRLGHLLRAETHLRRAIELDATNPAFWHDLGVVQYYLTDFEGCIGSMGKALSQHEDLHLSLFWLGNALYHLGCMDEAAQAFTDLLENYPNFTIAHFHLGVIHARRGEKAEATREFERVLIKNPQDAAARFYVNR